MEFSYLIFLCDKLSWLCYVRFRTNLPDEISNELHFVSVYVNECTREQNINNIVQPAPGGPDGTTGQSGNETQHGGVSEVDREGPTQPVSIAIDERQPQDGVSVQSLPEFKDSIDHKQIAKGQRSSSDPNMHVVSA